MHQDNFSHRNETVRLTHIPVYPCEPHPDTGYLLYLRNGRELRKRTWVKIDFVFEVGWGMLGVYEEDDGGEKG